MNNNFFRQNITNIKVFYIDFYSCALSVGTIETELDCRFAKHEAQLTREVFVRQRQQSDRDPRNRLFTLGQLERSDPVV